MPADAIALRAALRTLKIDEGAAMPIHGLAAVRIALIATRLVEDVLFIRPPTSHPSVEARWSALGEVVGSVEFVKPQVVVAGLDEAARRAANLREALPEAWWDTAYAHPQLHCDVHAPEYYKLVKLLDRTSFGDPNDPARVLKGRDDEHCDRALRAGLHGPGQQPGGGPRGPRSGPDCRGAIAGAGARTNGLQTSPVPSSSERPRAVPPAGAAWGLAH